jgi:DNA-binding MarR family transcriptional regulator
MTSDSVRGAEELLIRLSEFGTSMTNELAELAGDRSLVSNASIMVLCRLDLDGPFRPHEIAELEGMTTGGMSKLLDRLEARGLIERMPGTLVTDQRAVLVAITPEGSALARRMGEAVAGRLGEPGILLAELNRALSALAQDR